MCNFFTAIVTKDGRVLFTKQDSHETIVERAKLKDTTLLHRTWVRVEIQPKNGSWGPVTVDEQGSLPGWYEDDRAAFEDKVKETAEAVAPAKAAYNAARASAKAAYDAAVAPAEAAYHAAQASAYAAYDAALASAKAAYIDKIKTIPGYLHA